MTKQKKIEINEQVEEALEVQGHQFAVVRSSSPMLYDVLVKYKHTIVDKVNKVPLCFEDASELAIKAKEAFEALVEPPKQVTVEVPAKVEEVADATTIFMNSVEK